MKAITMSKGEALLTLFHTYEYLNRQKSKELLINREVTEGVSATFDAALLVRHHLVDLILRVK